MMKAAAPSVGGLQDRADAGGGHDPAALVLGIAGLAQQRPGDAAERDRGRDAGAGDRAEQEAGECGRPSRAGAAAPERGERDVDEEARGAAELEHRPVDREQHDVGRGDIERDPEDALEAHVALADDAVDPVALVADLQPIRDQPAEERVEQECDADRGQRPARGAARGLQHDDDRERAEDDVQRLGPCRAVDELGAGHDRVADRDHRERGHEPVGGVRLLGAPERDERQQQRDRQERGPVDLRRRAAGRPSRSRTATGRHRARRRAASGTPRVCVRGARLRIRR